jgi:SAM-dependent methyltransferase
MITAKGNYLMDQQALWNNIHMEGKHSAFSRTPSEFAQEVARSFPDHAKIIELGCGFGADAAFIAQQGCAVIATDLSEVAIARNKQRYGNIPGLTFQVVDMSNGTLPFQTDGFDGVYARLSLHYYPDKVTKQLFQDIHRVLKMGGRLAFICKTTNDPLYGKGAQLEEDMFDNKGHIRHFFSEGYARSLLVGYRIERLESKRQNLYGKLSSFIEVIAQRIA